MMPDWIEWLTETERIMERSARLDTVSVMYRADDVLPILRTVAALRALVGEQKPYVRHIPMPAGACRENYCYCGAVAVLTLTEDDMRKRLEEKS